MVGLIAPNQGRTRWKALRGTWVHGVSLGPYSEGISTLTGLEVGWFRIHWEARSSERPGWPAWVGTILASMIDLTVHQSDGGPTVYLKTFGCQMNELDSELVQGHLQALGYRFTEAREEAEVVLFNTCSVREQAENKVWSRLGELGLEKQAGRRVVVGVLGCMAEREGLALMKRMPQVDLMCGPGELDRLPMLIDNAMHEDVIESSGRVALQGNRSRRSTTLAAVLMSSLQYRLLFQMKILMA